MKLEAFLEAADAYGLRRGIDVSFFRDEYEGWYARLAFSDIRGPYSALVGAVEPRSMEAEADFRARVDKLCEAATVAAHKSRHVKKAA